MRKQLLMTVAASALTAAIGGSAIAADLMVKAPPRPLAPTWTGLYLGGHVGYGETKFRGGVIEGTDPNYLDVRDFKGGGFLLGLHAGYNLELGNKVVVGIEGDVTATPGWEKRSCDFAGFCDLTRQYAYGKLDALASIRGRLGLAFDRSLIYATAGVAWAKKTTSVLQNTSVNEHFGIRLGGVFGGGIEWKYNSALSLRAEGLYYVFNEKKTGPIDLDPALALHGIRNVGVVRIGASWHPQPN